MVLLNELEMATPGESDSPPATNEEEAASPSSAPQSPAAIIGSPDAAAEDMMPASMTPDPEENKQMEEPTMLESAAEEIMTSVDDAAEEVKSVIDNAQDAAQEKAGEMMESAMDHLRVEETIEKAEDMVDSAQNEMQETTQSLGASIGNKVAKFIDGNLRKVKSLLHLNEKTTSEEDMETAKNLSSSTGDLDIASSVRKSRACNIL